MFWNKTLRASLLESIPQREMGRWREREGKERARGRERERDWEGESSGEDGSPLRNDGIAVKLAQAEGSDYTHTFAEETRDPSAKLRGVGRKRRAGKWLWQRCDNFSCSTCCGSAELGAQQVGERSALFSNRMTRMMIRASKLMSSGLNQD